MKHYIFLFLAASVFLNACKESRSGAVLQHAQVIQVDSMPGTCPYVTKDNKGNIVVSWVRTISDSVSAFCYAVSGDGGRSFNFPVVIPSTGNIQPHPENLPKIIFKPSGEIIAVWGIANPNPNNKYSGLVFYSQSFDEGKSWSSPKPLVEDTAGYDQRYYDVDLLPGGEAVIIWLDNRKTTDQEGSALYLAITSGQKGFGQEKMISQGCCQCCRTDLFVDSKAGIHVLYRGIIHDSIRDMVHSVSTDGGKNFSDPRIINNDNWVIKGCPHTGPAMSENNEGLHFAWFTGGRNKGCYYTQSRDNGQHFDGYDRVSLLGSHPQVATMPGEKLAIAWDESVMVEGKYYKQVTIQLRSSAGKREKQIYITPDTSTAVYPVILPLNEHDVFITYTMKKRDKDYIMSQRVVL